MLKIKAKQKKVKEVKKEIEKIEANAKQAIEDMIVGGKDIEGVI